MPKNIQKSLMLFIQHKRLIFLFVTILTGILILFPSINFQLWLSQGDHGLDLYAFKKTLQGQLPYRDYFWMFGPLMPYYYAAFLFLFGVSIQSVILGYQILILLVGLAIFLIASLFICPEMSFIAALWYWAFRGQEFFYTYNHIGALLGMLMSIYFLFRNIRKAGTRNIFLGALCLLATILIRPNIGVSTLILFFVTLMINNAKTQDTAPKKRNSFYMPVAGFILSVSVFIYWLFLHSLPAYSIYQSFPYTKSYCPYDITAATFGENLQASIRIFFYNFTASPTRRLFGILLSVSILYLLFLIRKKQIDPKDKTHIFLTTGTLFVFCLVNLHEFLFSTAFYKLWWSFPVFILLCFFILGFATQKSFSTFTRFILCMALALVALFPIMKERAAVHAAKTPSNLLHIGKSKVYLSNPPGWIPTVTQTTDFIKQHVPSDEKILAVSYDALYYFLTERDSATRMVLLADIRIPEEQEKKIIQDIERSKIRYIILSSRTTLRDMRFGQFGIDYGQILNRYIMDHFAEVARFGDWDQKPDWTANHGVKILKKVLLEK